MLLQDQVCLLTGGGGGIGRAIAQGMAAHGAHVVVLDINADAANTTAASIGDGTASAHQVDVTSEEQCTALRTELEQQGLTVSVLVNSAGVVRRGTIDSANAVDDWNTTIGVDLTASFLLSRVFVPHLSASRGSIINIGSIQSFMHTNNSVAYTAAKHGLVGLTKSMAAELGPAGIRVNGIAPGPIETDLNRANLAANPQRLAGFIARTPLGELVSVEDVANVSVFLASGLARGVTGTMLPVDGGFLCL